MTGQARRGLVLALDVARGRAVGVRDLLPRGESFERVMRALVADGTDDGAFDAAHDVGFIAELADFLEHGGFIFFGNVRAEDDDHNAFL